MIHHVFEVFQQRKRDQTVVVIEDPYSMTSQYTGVSRTKVAQIAQSVRDTGTVPPLSPWQSLSTYCDSDSSRRTDSRLCV